MAIGVIADNAAVLDGVYCFFGSLFKLLAHTKPERGNAAGREFINQLPTIFRRTIVDGQIDCLLSKDQGLIT